MSTLYIPSRAPCATLRSSGLRLNSSLNRSPIRCAEPFSAMKSLSSSSDTTVVRLATLCLGGLASLAFSVRSNAPTASASRLLQEDLTSSSWS